MSTKVQRVVVIQDASRDVNLSALRWVLQGFSLKPGDVLILLGVLHQVINPSTLSFMGAGKLLGYKFKVDSTSTFSVNPMVIREEVARKKEEYSNNTEIMEISKQCETEQIEFHIEVEAGSSPRIITLRAAKTLEATWVILERQMKKDKKYFMEKLSCGISRMKRDNTIKQLRGPKAREDTEISAQRITKSRGEGIGYDEMIPEMISSLSKQQVSPSVAISHQNSEKSPYSKSPTSDQPMIEKASTSSPGYHEGSCSNFTEAKGSPLNTQEKENIASTQREVRKEQSPYAAANFQQMYAKEPYITGDPGEELKQHENNADWVGSSSPDEHSVCSTCNNRRPKIGWKRDFTYAELHAATNGFSDKNFLSEGGFGSVYKGELNGLNVAVKLHKSASFQGEKEFKSEVNVLSRARHENLVMLLGSCSEGSHWLLVYEYVCNGSLDQHLSKHTRRHLSWSERMKIAMGAAKGLQYLHENNIIHRDMRPNNILITHDHNARLGDFGLARTQHEDSDQTLETRVVGTLGYLAPEYAECGKVSTKTDVYAFGVVLLQLITGLKTTDKVLGGRSLVGWARPLLKEKNYPDLIDQRILDSHDIHQLFWMVRVAERCLCKDPRKRLTMDKVVDALNHITESSTSCNIKDFSPAQSESGSSIRDSFESPEDEASFTIETASFKSMNLRNARDPSSPPLRLLTSPVLAISSTRSNVSSSIYIPSMSGNGGDDEWSMRRF